MKHFSLFLLVLLACGLLPLGSRAQAPDSLSQKLRSIFANIDKSQVPTGYLYEAGVRFLSPFVYDGTLTDSSRTNMDVLRYLRAQLASSRVYGTDTLPSLPAFNARLQAAVATANGAIPIAMQYMPYASIRPDALQNNLLTVQNEQVFNVAGRSESPYQTNVLFAAAPELSYSRTGTVSFLFRKNLYLSGNGATPGSLALDFGDGNGYQAVTWGQPIGTTYATAGTKRIKVKALFQFFAYIGRRFVTTTETRESWFDFQVLNAGAAARYGANGQDTYYLKPPGNPYGATVTVVYGKNHGQHVVKPFIVVEQYNLAGAAPHLIECNNANNTVEQLLFKIGNDFTGPFDFNTHLESAGYDLIYIDFEENLDDITRNAQVVAYIIQQVNAWKAISQTQFGLAIDQNVVMGMSMGGLIGRYALADMTRNPSPSHFGPPDTRLLVLHDSPQRGAYNPLGLQTFTRATGVPLNIALLSPAGALLKPSLSSFNGKLSDALYVLDRPASQQLGILSALDSRGNDIRPNSFIDGVYKSMVDFTPANPNNTSGTPQPAYQIVANSDGSQCGLGSGAPLGVQLSSADTFTYNWLKPLNYMPGFTLGVRGAAYGLPAYGQQALISRMRVYIEYRISLGPCPFCVTIPIRFNLLNENATSPPNTLPYETLPGGTTNLATESGDCANQTFPVSLFLTSSLYNGPICFVPTYSALDVATVAPTTAFAKYVNNMTDNPSVPRVARYIAQANPTNAATAYNLNHLTFAPRNSEWIYDQMENLPLASNYCSTECLPLTISSSLLPGQRLCTGSSITLSIPGLAAGTVVTWTTAPAGFFTTASGSGPTFTTTAAVSGPDTGTITATIGPCNNTVSINVPVGTGEPSGRYVVGGFFSGSGTPLQTNNPAGPDKVNIIVDAPYNFTFTADPSSVSVSSLGGGQASFYMPAGGGGVTITATATNAPAGCGVVGHWAFFPAPYRMFVTPNPASTDLTVSVIDPAGPPAPPPTADPAPFDADLYNNFGKKVKTKRSERGKAVLDVRDLPEGLYVVRVGQGKNALSENVQITH